MSEAFLGTASTGRQFKEIPVKGMATEVYCDRRFFFLCGGGSVTGAVDSNPQTEIYAVCEVLKRIKASRIRAAQAAKHQRCPPRGERAAVRGGVTLRVSDAAILEKIRASPVASKFNDLYAGNIAGYASQSEADLALAGILMWWCDNDTAQAERLFNGSALAQRGKWCERADYRERTLDKAMALQGGYKVVLPVSQAQALAGGKRCKK